MHIEVGLPQQSPKVLGIGNTSRCQNELATAAAKTFNGLPEGGSRWEALSVVKRLQRELSLTATQVSHLEFLVGYTRDQDWGSGSNPIVYLTVSATANLRGICERQVLNIEHALNRAGLVCWHDSGNQRRYGHRSANGELKQAFGVNLAPLAASYDRLLKMVHEQEHRAQIWKQEKATLLLLKRALREQLTLDPANGSSAQAMGLIKSLPRRVEARVPITQLVRWSQQIKDLLERFEQSAAAKDQQRGLGAPSVPHLGAESE
ncbi:Replication protein C N-terminal domain-containing protein, partial [Pseudovibrio axinellae]